MPNMGHTRQSTCKARFQTARAVHLARKRIIPGARQSRASKVLTPKIPCEAIVLILRFSNDGADEPLAMPCPLRRKPSPRLTEMNLQLHHVVSDITGATGMRIIRAIIAGERDPAVLASMRDTRCHSSAEMIEQALTGHYRGEHLFVLEQALALYDVYQQKVAACDIRIEFVLKELSSIRGRKEDARADGSGSPRRRSRQSNGPDFDVGKALHSLLGKDLTRIHGMGPYLALKLVSECGDDLSAWPSAKHFTSWLCLAPSNKISGGKVLSSRTRRSGSRAASLLRLAAVTIGRTDTALGAFYRRLSARAGKSKAVTATARKIATLFYNALRHGMDYVDPGASYYETRYRERVVKNLHRRAKAFGFILQAAEMPAAEQAVS